MLRFKIFYGDGSTFTDQDALKCKEGIFDAPGRDVQIIAQVSRYYGWHCQAENYAYVLDERGGVFRWWGVDKFGMWDYLVEPGKRKVIFGRSTSTEEYSDIVSMACDDPYLPKKTADAIWERRVADG